MLCFFLGLIVGGILGVIIVAILSVGSTADDKAEYMWEKFNRIKKEEQRSVVLKS